MSRVRFKTSLGEFVVALDAGKAPLTAANFLEYVGAGFYDGTIVHRVEPGFVIQMGGYDAQLRAKPTRDGVRNEWRNGLKNKRGTLSMARTEDPDSATSQFFVNLNDNDFLDEAVSGGAGYAVFGDIAEGMDVIDKIAAAKTREEPRLGGMPCPTPAVVIESAGVEA